MKHITPLFAVLTLALATTVVWAQDPVKVDAKHYKVEFENAQVRVLRIHYGPKEKSVMHSHPAGVAVFLTEGKFKFTLPAPGGKTQDMTVKAGEARFIAAEAHLPENTGDKAFELILVELKAPAAAAAPAKAPTKAQPK